MYQRNGARRGSRTRRRRESTARGTLVSCARPRVSLCPEGWYYLFVVAFIIGGAVLREVNLLVLLAGMMCGPLIFNFRWVATTLEALQLRRTHVERAMAGNPFTVRLAVRNPRRFLAAWAIILDDSVVRDESKDNSPQTARVLLPRVSPGQTTAAEYRLCLMERGLYQAGPVRLSTRYPFGLVRARSYANLVSDIIVWPRLGELSVQWRRLIRQAHLGQRISHPRKGLLEGDYYGLREWRGGDSQRWIHWRTSARLNELTVKQFEQQRDDDLTLVADLWMEETATETERDAVEEVIRFVATVVMDRCRRGGLQLRLQLRAAEPRDWNAAASQSLGYDVMDELARTRPAAWGSAAALEPIAEECVRAGRKLVVISSRARPEHFLGRFETHVVWISPADLSNWFHDSPPALDDERERPDDAEPIPATDTAASDGNTPSDDPDAGRVAEEPVKGEPVKGEPAGQAFEDNSEQPE